MPEEKNLQGFCFTTVSSLRLNDDIDIGRQAIGALNVGDAEFESEGAFGCHQRGKESGLAGVGIKQGDFTASHLGPVVLE